ncbi:methyltransferase domain-containing protein [Yinghuangia sp. YIM S10712]|uniref:methyltransferase domain-containing protein n=1 Tax=Yinghuangia sp. YIM S10712 TaxID=3436930 RepID=UPI003F52C0D6
MAGDSIATKLLGRDRSPFLPDAVWHFKHGRHVRIDRRDDPLAWQEAANADCPLVTQWDDGTTDNAESGIPTCSASMPSMVEQMLDACDVRQGHRVLEVGTGTGYTAALLKDRVGESGTVVTVEVDPVLADQARGRLAAAGVDAEVHCGDGLEGWPAGAPYDRVHVTCGIRSIPTAWLAQCPNGTIMLPWSPVGSDACDHVVALAVRNGVAVGRFGPEVAFMKARMQRTRPWSAWPDTGNAVATTLPIGPTEVNELIGVAHGFVLGLLAPELTFRFLRASGDEDEHT